MNKTTIWVGAILVSGILGGCNQPNNGEQPPANELPAPARSTAGQTGAAGAGADRQQATPTAGASANAATSAAEAASSPARADSTETD